MQPGLLPAAGVAQAPSLAQAQGLETLLARLQAAQAAHATAALGLAPASAVAPGAAAAERAAAERAVLLRALGAGSQPGLLPAQSGNPLHPGLAALQASPDLLARQQAALQQAAVQHAAAQQAAAQQAAAQQATAQQHAAALQAAVAGTYSEAVASTAAVAGAAEPAALGQSASGAALASQLVDIGGCAAASSIGTVLIAVPPTAGASSTLQALTGLAPPPDDGGGAACVVPPTAASAAPASSEGAETAASASGASPPAAKPAEAPAAEEVPRCHLHRKLNKACKYCKAYAAFTEMKNKENEDRRSAALERLKGGSGPKSGKCHDDKVPVPNSQYFPAVLRDRMLASNFYNNVLANQDFHELREALESCDTCETEVRGLNLDAAPSQFISIVFKLLNSKLSEGQLRQLLHNKNRFVRCAGAVFVRLGVHQDRYWELLSEALLDIEEFTPFPGKGSEKMDKMSDGQYVEQLLTKEKYCELSLPRIAVAQRKLLNERLVLYDQFRRRYAANLEVLDRFSDEDGDVAVEVCSVDGEWTAARTSGRATGGRRRVSVPVRLSLDDENDIQHVSIGMLICPPMKGSADPQDLTQSRGRSYQDLLERHRAQQRDAAVATGKDYCKNSGRRTVHAGGMTFIAGEKPGEKTEKRRREEEDEEETRAKDARRNFEKSAEHQAKMAAIMEKYCQTRAASGSQDSSRSNGLGPDRMRLG